MLLTKILLQMKVLKVLTFVVFSTSLFFSCSTVTKYQTSNFMEYQKSHKTVAIVPFGITLDHKSMPKNMGVEDLNKLQKDASLYLQDYFYVLILNRDQKSKYSTKFQDVRITNNMLLKNDITFYNMSDIDKTTLAQTCNVDAVISCFIYISNPVTNSAKVLNRVDIKISIHDKNGKLLWEYYDSSNASPKKSTIILAKQLLEDIINKIPYAKSLPVETPFSSK